MKQNSIKEHQHTPNEPLLSVESVAQLLNISKRSVYKLIRNRELEALLVGKFLRIQPVAVQRLIDQKTMGDVR